MPLFIPNHNSFGTCQAHDYHSHLNSLHISLRITVGFQDLPLDFSVADQLDLLVRLIFVTGRFRREILARISTYHLNLYFISDLGPFG